MIGLSATLPNFIDVAHFLQVNVGDEGGCFYFDASIRPVPLVTKFTGINDINQRVGKGWRRSQDIQ